MNLKRLKTTPYPFFIIESYKMIFGRRWLYTLLLSGTVGSLIFIFNIAAENNGIQTTLFVSFIILSLYVFEPIPLGQISLLAIFLLLVTRVATVDQVLLGFATEAAFVVLLGIFLNNAMAMTSIPSRIVYFILDKIGGFAGGLLVSIIILPIITAIFIPATVVRTTSLIPVVYKVLRWLDVAPDSNAGRKKMMALAIGSNISSIVFVTAAPANLIAVEIINLSLGFNIGYLDWFVFMLPIWLVMVPISCVVLNFVYRDGGGEKLEKAELFVEKNKLGGLSINDKTFIIVMVFTIGVWLTQSLHGLSLVVPMFLAVVALSFPKIGVIAWKDIKIFNIDLFLLVGTTVSLAGVLSASGTIAWATEGIENSFLSTLFENPFLAIISAVILTQVFHVMITNVNTAIITFLPIVIGISVAVGSDSLILSLSVTASCVLCFLLAIESLASTTILATGTVSQLDFIKTGIWMTIVSIIVVIFAALYWWPLFTEQMTIGS